MAILKIINAYHFASRSQHHYTPVGLTLEILEILLELAMSSKKSSALKEGKEFFGVFADTMGNYNYADQSVEEAVSNLKDLAYVRNRLRSPGFDVFLKTAFDNINGKYKLLDERRKAFSIAKNQWVNVVQYKVLRNGLVAASGLFGCNSEGKKNHPLADIKALPHIEKFLTPRNN